MHGFQGGGHVGAFGHALAAVGQQGLGVSQVQFVLGGAGEGGEAGHGPHGIAAFGVFGHRGVLGGGHQFGVTGQGSAFHFLHLLEHVDLDAFGIIDHAAGVGHGDGLGAQLEQLFAAVGGHVAGTGNGADFAFQAFAAVFQHVLGKIHGTVAGGFRTGQGTAEEQVLAGQHAFVAAGQALELAEHVAHFAAAHADVTGGHVDGGTDVTVQLGHEGLAEAHDFGLGLALGIEVGTALAAADGQTGQGVLEDLFEAQELEDAQVHAGMEAQAALVGADGGVVLHAVAAVDLDLTLVVHPFHAEADDAFGLGDALEDLVLFVLGVFVQQGLEGHQHFFHGLEEDRFAGVLLFQAFNDSLSVRHGCTPLCSVCA